MRGRRVWSDERVRELTKEFVLATDEVWRLQGGFDSEMWRDAGGDDPERLLFQEMAADGHYGGGKGTKQGIYVCTPNGKLLSSINSNSPRRVAAMLEAGLARWRAIGTEDDDGESPKSEPKHRYEWSAPKNGCRLRVTMRYAPRDDDPTSEQALRYNHDALWFSAEEVRKLLPEDLGSESHAWPEDSFQRLARLTLVDAVVGEARSMPRAEGEVTTEVVDVKDGVAVVRFQGTTESRGDPTTPGLFQPLGLKAEILGFAEFDIERGEFVEYELLAKGVRWTKPNRARRAVQPLCWYLTLVDPDVPADGIAPTRIREYGASWVEQSR